MSLRTRIFIVISLLLFVIIGISLLLLARQRSPESAAPTPGSETPAVPGSTVAPGGGSPGSGTPAAIPPAPARELSAAARLNAEKQGVVNFARVFIERYQTYSSDNNWQNIREVETMVTPELWIKLSKQIGNTASGGFVGVTTAALGGSLLSWEGERATVSVRATRATEKSGEIVRASQEATVELVKVSGEWRVASFVWQP